MPKKKSKRTTRSVQKRAVESVESLGKKASHDDLPTGSIVMCDGTVAADDCGNSPVLSIVKAGSGCAVPLAQHPLRPVILLTTGGNDSNKRAPNNAGLFFVPDVQFSESAGLEYLLSNPEKMASMALHALGSNETLTINRCADAFLAQLNFVLAIGKAVVNRTASHAPSLSYRVRAQTCIADASEWTSFERVKRSGGDARVTLRIPPQVMGKLKKLARLGRYLRFYREESLNDQQSSTPIHLDPTDEAILSFLLDKGGRLTTGKIAAALNLKEKSIGKNLVRLRKAGFIETKSRKGFALTKPGESRAREFE